MATKENRKARTSTARKGGHQTEPKKHPFLHRNRQAQNGGRSTFPKRSGETPETRIRSSTQQTDMNKNGGKGFRVLGF
jgi:hypothetical protein